jgi:FkbM family methyltransferase
MNIVQKGLRKIKSKAISIGFDKVKWNRVKGGPGRGLLLFVNKYSFHGWREMLNGSFDSFWYKRLSDSGMKFNAILDVGAHFGYHSMCLKKLYPNSNVLAIEPNPYNAERLELHLSKNKLKEIKVLMLAASNEEGELDFSYSDNVESSQSTGSYLANVKPPLSSEHYKSFKKAKVSACTLDLICERNSFIPDLVKIDVEGAEVLVLKGSLRLLKDIKPFLCIEAHSPLLEAEVINVLKHDYQIEILDRDKGRSFLFCTPKL